MFITGTLGVREKRRWRAAPYTRFFRFRARGRRMEQIKG
jgi:hypothetical protein